MALFTSYDAVGIKEDVSDIITNISPTKTPFQSAIGREKVTQRDFQWQADTLRPAAYNAQYEGFDAGYGAAAAPIGNPVTTPGTIAFDVIAPTMMMRNQTQIFAEAIQISGSMEATSTYGRARESAYQLAKAAAAVKRDLEIALVGVDNIGGGFTGNGGTLRTMTSYPELLYNNLALNFGGAGGAGLPAAPPTGYGFPNMTYSIYGTGAGTATPGYTTPTGAATYTGIPAAAAGNNNGTLNEGALLQALQNSFNNGAEPDCVYVTPANAAQIASFAKAAGRYRFIQDNSGSNKQVVNAVDLYVSPYGEIRVYISRFLSGAPLTSGVMNTAAVSAAGGILGTTFQTPQAAVAGGAAFAATYGTGNSWTLVVDPSMWSLATLRPWFREVLAKTGDSIKQMIVGEFSLKVKNPLASSLVVDTGVQGTVQKAWTAWGQF